jgi:hypothetical protein
MVAYGAAITLASGCVSWGGGWGLMVLEGGGDRVSGQQSTPLCAQ